MAVAKREPKAEAQDKRWLVWAGAGVVVVGLAAWWWGRPNPQLAKVREMQKELFAKSPEKLTPEERKEQFEALRAEREKLSPEERKDLRKEVGQQFQNKFSADAIAYTKMTPAEKLKFIDGRLAREQAMMQKKTPAKSGATPPAPGGSSSPPPNGVLANPGGSGGGATPKADGGPPQGKTPRTAEDRDNRRRETLLHVPAEARAAMDQIRVDMAARRAQLGIPTPQPKGPPR